MTNRDKKTDDQAIVPGRKPVLELIDASPEKIDTVFLQQGAHGKEIAAIVERCKAGHIRFRNMPRHELDKIYPGNTQGVVARLASQGFMDLETLLDQTVDAPLPVLVALDQVQDPGNVGTLARTLYALGGAGLIVPKDRTAYLGGAAQKASAGALAKLPVSKVVNLARALDQCLDRGFDVVATTLGPKATNMYEARLSTPTVLVLGNEEKGVRPNVLKRATQELTIPLARPFDSLNVAQAGAIVLAEYARRQRD
ncbi:TrmH family RNA methyltransferase [Desulfovibrio ferrophilus]|uniref:RNA methyltransferase, TrmH family, group 3 n=1 Tax=Desulfovibrio ferrophilus TaxID=241368 RepID=A0A2Z6B1Y9_9BACT|nr:RNA methyltransferase [Desulfovibrio ferrophilus]BBD09450.1 RNA methyltransferase, TrmH family, group 3 [Desulfovibrio ferrophilus]